jgi:peptide/nickel transport system substrate-binding protein
VSAGERRDGSEEARGLTRRDVLVRGGAVAAGAIGLAALAGCGDDSGGGGATTGGGGSGDTGGSGGSGRTRLVVGDFGVSETLDMDGLSQFNPTFMILLNAYEPALHFTTVPNADDLGGGLMIDASEFQPGLVERWERNERGDVWTFYVRRGVRSAFGNECTSADFEWTYRRALGLERVGAAQFARMGVERFEVVDDYTFRFHTRTASPVVEPTMTSQLWIYTIDSREAQKHVTDDDPWAERWLQENAAGFGPYVVSDWRKGQSITLTAKEDYYGEPPQFREVHIVAIPNDSTRLNSLQSGDIDIAMELPASAVDRASRDPRLHTYQFNGNKQAWLILSGDARVAPQLQDKRIRQAIAWAIPYDEIARSIYFGRAKQGRTIVPAYVPGSAPELWPYTTDLEKAKSLVQEVGGNIEIPLTYASDRAEPERVAVILQTALGEAGIRVTLRKMSQDEISQTLVARNGSIPFVLQDWTSIFLPDPQAATIFVTSTSVTNLAGWKNDEVDRLAAEGATEIDQQKRIEIYTKVQEILAEELPYIPMLDIANLYVTRRGIEDVTWDVSHLLRFKPIRDTGSGS